jgi:transposase InsO family protein
MAWEKFKLEEQRLQVIEAYMNGEASMTAICAKYGISTKTAYKWYKRYLELGKEGLYDLSKAPHNPHCIFTQDQVERALDLKRMRLTWGPKKILAKLLEMYPNEEWPSATRLYEIFKEFHLVTRRRLKSRVPATAPLGHITECNDTWAIDLKGWFLTGDGMRCEPLTITDCNSRFLICCTHLDKHTAEDVWSILNRAFQEYGLPKRIRSDNGSPFGSVGAGRLTGLAVNIIKAGVIPEWINPGHPEENGRHERFHLTLKQEVATPPKETLALQVQALEGFKYDYNYERPHEALNMKKPSECHTTSNRIWGGVLRSPEYNRRDFEVRKVEKSGQITWKGNHIYISETLQGEYVGLKQIADEYLEVFYGQIYLGKIGGNKLEKPKMQTRRQR